MKKRVVFVLYVGLIAFAKWGIAQDGASNPPPENGSENSAESGAAPVTLYNEIIQTDETGNKQTLGAPRISVMPGNTAVVTTRSTTDSGDGGEVSLTISSSVGEGEDGAYTIDTKVSARDAEGRATIKPADGRRAGNADAGGRGDSLSSRYQMTSHATIPRKGVRITLKNAEGSTFVLREGERWGDLKLVSVTGRGKDAVATIEEDGQRAEVRLKEREIVDISTPKARFDEDGNIHVSIQLAPGEEKIIELGENADGEKVSLLVSIPSDPGQRVRPGSVETRGGIVTRVRTSPPEGEEEAEEREVVIQPEAQ